MQVLNERVAPLTGRGAKRTLLVTGCRPGDGASTVAMGLAIDLSQRLGLRTLLVDAHLRKPTLHKLFPPAPSKSPTLLLGDQFVVRPSTMPHLELASCLPMTAGALSPATCRSTKRCSTAFRWRSSTSAWCGLTDACWGWRGLPIRSVVVTRYGSTERDELATTVAALKAASRSVAGVIINGVPQYPSPLRKWARVSSRRW